MLFKHDKSHVDLSLELADEVDWQIGTLKKIHHHLDIVALATEPVSGLLAVGLSQGYITLYGSPGVECTLQLSDPPHARISFLTFAGALFRLLCVDEHHRLHIWDLSTLSRPRLLKVVHLPQPVNCLSVSPSHTHLFIALTTGEIKTYDLLCLRMSPYSIPPNLWDMYEEKVQASGLPVLETPGANQVVDMVIHPRDLNLLFIAYGGGVALLDLKQQNTVRTYELVLSPGAPGGEGYYAQDILLPRRPTVTALTVHPSGHLLAVGHADGCIAFWSLEDEDKPLLVRTLDEAEDVAAVDVIKLESALPSNDNAERGLPEAREPIFKLAWSGFPNSSDPRGGDTVLTVLGGLAQDAPPGLTIFLLPPLHPPAPPAPDAAGAKAPAQPSLHPDVRAAILDSLSPLDSHTYHTPGAVQDFLLIPRSSPHFSGTYDPQAVLLFFDSDLDPTSSTRIVDALEFPPPAFVASLMNPTTPASAGLNLEDPSAALSQELATTLESMSLGADPRVLRLPWDFWSVCGSGIWVVGKEAYGRLKEEAALEDALSIRGGKAWVEDTEGQMKLLKFQPHHVLVTYDPDLVLRFLDLSAQLLTSSSDNSVKTSFPNALPALTIELGSLIHDPSLRLAAPPSSSASIHSLSTHSGGEVSPTVGDTGGIAVEAVHLAPESLECVVVMKNGAVILSRLDAEGATGTSEIHDEELVSLTHVPVRAGLRYYPFLGVKAVYGRVSACAVSDVGFLAVAYANTSLLVIDLRGPRVVLRIMPPSRKDHRHSFRSGRHDPIVSLIWTVCPTVSDPILRIRLIASTSSGSASIYALARSPSGGFEVSGPPVPIEAAAQPLPSASFIVDAKTGARVTADRQGLSMALDGGAAEGGGRRCVWVSAGAKGVRCVVDLDGERVGKVDWPGKSGAVVAADVVEKNGGCALVAFTERGEALVYSLPFLEHLHTLQLPLLQPSLSRISTDSTGDWITHTLDPTTGLARLTTYGTLFATRRVAPYAPPLVDLMDGRGSVPAQPAPVPLEPQTVLGTVLGYLGHGVTTGAEIDALLAGPDRPEPPKSIYDPTGRLPPADTKAKDKRDVGSSAARSASAEMSSGVGDLYNRLGSALAERGEMLGNLEEQFQSLEQGSKNMVAQAQKLAAQQSAKRWFGF